MDSFEKKEWGGRLSKSMRYTVRNEFTDYNGLHYTHYLYRIARHVSDMYNNWMEEGFPGKAPDFSEVDYIILCNCGGGELTFEENDGKWGVEIPLLKGEESDWFRLRTGEYQRKLLEQYDIKGNTKIVKKDSRFELHQPVEVPDIDTDYGVQTRIGVDFNFDRLAVMTVLQDGKLQESQFFDKGRKLQHYREKVQERKKEYQEKGRYDKVEELGDRQTRFTRQLLHNISRKIVDTADEYERPVIRVEDTGIEEMREQVNTQNKNWFKTRINQWPVGQLIDFIEYKAEKQGIKVEKVSPEYTSQKCNKCGEKGVRPYKGNQQRFYCPDCNYEIDADFNAAVNMTKGKNN